MPENTNESTTLKYEVVFTNPKDNTVYSDIHFIYFIRTPIIKQASFSIVQMNLPVVIISQLMQDVATNIFNVWNLTIYAIDEKEDIQVQEIYSKNITIISVIPQEPITFTHPSAIVRILLVNPVLYSLSTSTGFNKIISNKTALDGIKEFENFLDTNYGKFNHNKVGINEKVNNFRYEQIFIPPTINTLNVPKYIINSYKPFHSYSIYFFDDFHFDENSDKEVTCHFLNLYNLPSTFPHMFTNEYLDFSRFTRKTGKVDFSDQFRVLDKPFASVIYRLKDMVFEFQKQAQSTVTNIASGKSDIVTFIDKSMKIAERAQMQSKKIGQSVRANTIYTPDSSENANERIKTAQEMMFNKFEQICFYETERCLPDWLQFGCIYNMEGDAQDDFSRFLYTPISIINIFKRISEKDTEIYCYHMSKYAMLKLMDDETT